MKQYIYKSDFNFGPDSTEKKEVLFGADLDYAISKDYRYIQTSDERVFRIDANDELTKVDVTEEGLQKHAVNQQKLLDSLKSIVDAQEAEAEAKHTEQDCSAYDKSEHNLRLIDGIINNTLSTKVEKINSDQADTMLKLAHLKLMLIESNNFQ